jgi:hypothetical protein
MSEVTEVSFTSDFPYYSVKGEKSLLDILRKMEGGHREAMNLEILDEREIFFSSSCSISDFLFSRLITDLFYLNRNVSCPDFSLNVDVGSITAYRPLLTHIELHMHRLYGDRVIQLFCDALLEWAGDNWEKHLLVVKVFCREIRKKFGIENKSVSTRQVYIPSKLSRKIAKITSTKN